MCFSKPSRERLTYFFNKKHNYTGCLWFICSVKEKKEEGERLTDIYRERLGATRDNSSSEREK